MRSELKRILYAEDEKDIQEIVRISLGELGGFEIKICSSGGELLEAFDEFDPQLVLMDVMMPGMDGIETFKNLKLKPSFNDRPLVFMTAKVQTNEVQEYKDLGAVEVISKPFNPIELPDRIRDIWNQLP